MAVGAAHAQDTTPEADQAADAPLSDWQADVPADTDAAGTPDANTSAADAPDATAPETDTAEAGAEQEEGPREVIAAVHTDWQIRCTTDERACFMYQLAVDARDVPVAEVNIIAISGSEELAAGATVVTPLMTFLPPGLQIKIDEGEVQRQPYEFCAAQGCVARFGMTSERLDEFRRGSKALMSVTSADDRENPIILELSLSGFTAAFADLASR